MRARRRSLWALLGILAIWLALLGQRRVAGREFVLDGVFFLAVAVVLFLAAVWRQPEAMPALYPDNAPPLPDEERVSWVGPRLRNFLLVAGVVLAAVAFASLGHNHYTARGVVCWWAAVLAWLATVVDRRPGSLRERLPRPAALLARWRRGLNLRVSWAAGALLAILALSFFFHIYRIDSVPPEAQSDHVEASEDVRSILNGDYMIFFPRNTGREGTQFYLTAALSHVFGYGFTTLKLTMALIGALNVIPMYFLGKELWDKKLGLLAAFFMAISYWHVMISRIGWRIVFASFWVTITLWLLLRAFRTRRRNDYVWAGLALGGGLYGYMSFRVVPLLVVVLAVLKLLLDRGPKFDWRRFALSMGVLVVTAVLVYLPMFRYMYDEPKMLWYRVMTRTSDLETTIKRSPAVVFADNVKRGLLMFNWTSDAAWPQSILFKPSLEPIMAGLLVLGAGYLLYLLCVKRRPAALYLVVAIFVLLLPSTLSIAFPIENPSNTRASGVIPIVVLLVALPVYVVGRQLTRALRGGTGALIVAVLGGLLLFQAGKANFNAYFVEYYNDYRHAAPNTSDIAKVIRGFGDSVGDTYDAYIFSSPYWIDHRAVSLRLQDMNWNNNLLHVQDAEPHLSEPRNRLYIFRPDNIEAENWLLEHYPQGHLMRYQAFIPERDFMVFLSPAQ